MYSLMAFYGPKQALPFNLIFVDTHASTTISIQYAAIKTCQPPLSGATVPFVSPLTSGTMLHKCFTVYVRQISEEIGHLCASRCSAYFAWAFIFHPDESIRKRSMTTGSAEQRQNSLRARICPRRIFFSAVTGSAEPLTRARSMKAF